MDRMIYYGIERLWLSLIFDEDDARTW